MQVGPVDHSQNLWRLGEIKKTIPKRKIWDSNFFFVLGCNTLEYNSST